MGIDHPIPSLTYTFLTAAHILMNILMLIKVHINNDLGITLFGDRLLLNLKILNPTQNDVLIASNPI